MEKALNIKLKDGSIVTKPCYIANQGTKYNTIPDKYLTNLKYVDDKGDVKNLLGTLIHTVRGMDTEEAVTEFEFRFQDLNVVKEKSVVLVIMDEKETYAIGTANFVLNILMEDLGEFSLKRGGSDFSSYKTTTVFYGEINLGSLMGVVGLLQTKRNLKAASSLYEVIRKDLLLVSTDSERRTELLGDVVCTPLDKPTMDILAPMFENMTSYSRLGSSTGHKEVEHGKMRIVDISSSFCEESVLFFDGVKWYHYSYGEPFFRCLLQSQDRLLTIARNSQFGEIG